MTFNDMPTENSKFLQSLKLSPISQIGIVVENIHKAAAYYGALLNIRNWFIPNVKSDECFYKGKAIKQKLEFIIGYSGKTQIELIAQECDEENIYNFVLGRNSFGLHHLGVTVSNLEKKLEEIKKIGIQPLQTGIIHTGSGITTYAYLDTREQAGFIFELIESKAFGFSIGMPQWLMKLGALTGDTTTLS